MQILSGVVASAKRGGTPTPTPTPTDPVAYNTVTMSNANLTNREGWISSMRDRIAAYTVKSWVGATAQIFDDGANTSRLTLFTVPTPTVGVRVPLDPPIKSTNGCYLRGTGTFEIDFEVAA